MVLTVYPKWTRKYVEALKVEPIAAVFSWFKRVRAIYITRKNWKSNLSRKLSKTLKRRADYASLYSNADFHKLKGQSICWQWPCSATFRIKSINQPINWLPAVQVHNTHRWFAALSCERGPLNIDATSDFAVKCIQMPREAKDMSALQSAILNNPIKIN